MTKSTVYNTVSTTISATCTVSVVDSVKAIPCKNGNGYFVSARCHASNGTATITEWISSRAGAEAVVTKLAAKKGEKVQVKLSQRNTNSYEDGRTYTNFLGKFSI